MRPGGTVGFRSLLRLLQLAVLTAGKAGADFPTGPAGGHSPNLQLLPLGPIRANFSESGHKLPLLHRIIDCLYPHFMQKSL